MATLFTYVHVLHVVVAKMTEVADRQNKIKLQKTRQTIDTLIRLTDNGYREHQSLGTYYV